MSDSLRPHGLHRPWKSPGQNTGVGSLPLLQGSSQLRSPALQADSLPAEPPRNPRNHLCVHLSTNCSLVCEWFQFRFFLLQHVFYCMITSALIYPSCHWWTLRLGQLWTTLLWAFSRRSAHMHSLLLGTYTRHRNRTLESRGSRHLLFNGPSFPIIT